MKYVPNIFDYTVVPEEYCVVAEHGERLTLEQAEAACAILNAKNPKEIAEKISRDTIVKIIELSCQIEPDGAVYGMDTYIRETDGDGKGIDKLVRDIEDIIYGGIK